MWYVLALIYTDLHSNFYRFTALQQGQLPIIVEEPTMTGARRFFQGGRCDTAGPKAPKPQANGTTDTADTAQIISSTSSGSPHACTHSYTAMSEA